MTTSTLDHAPAAAGALSRLRASRWTPQPIVLAGTFMVVLDFFIVNVALPSMQSQLCASDSAVKWVVAGYSLTSAVLLVAGGRLGDGDPPDPPAQDARPSAAVTVTLRLAPAPGRDGPELAFFSTIATFATAVT